MQASEVKLFHLEGKKKIVKKSELLLSMGKFKLKCGKSFHLGFVKQVFQWVHIMETKPVDTMVIMKVLLFLHLVTFIWISKGLLQVNKELWSF